MPETPNPISPVVLRLASLLFPPAGLVLLWRTPRKLSKKVLGTVGILLFALLYSGLLIFLLMQFTGLQIEWRGGYMPAFTYRKTRTDYEAVEQSRAHYLSLTSVQRKQVTAKPYWTSFRGPNAEGHYDE